MKNGHLGVMLDCSRNSVMTIDGFKRFILNLEKMGYNLLQLYTEDTYEIPEEPLFGHFRGKLTQAEIREIDAFAREHGIELQPCIQTLAHLNQIFYWNKFAPINDVGDILLAEDEKTYDLIEKMFKSIANSYSTKTINIGMDEAMLLGAGKYFNKHGYKRRFDILMCHLKKVSEIAKKYDFQLLMWSDMFFRLVNEGLYYPKDGEKCKVVPKEIRNQLPENVTLVYWDYYSDYQEIYDDMFDRHFDFGKQVWFAGGAWKWLGFHSGNQLSYGRIENSIKSCVKKDVNDIVLTMWGDCGNETPAVAVLPALLYASECLKGNFSIKDLKKKFEEVFDEKYDDFMLFDMIRPDHKERCSGDSCGVKEFLYNDTFMGKFDSTVVGDEGEFFVTLEKKFRNAKKRSKKYAYIFESYEKLCKVMKVKYTLGFRTRNAYKENNKEELLNIVNDYTKTIKNLEEFIVYFRKMWFTDSKPHGFDVQDIRIGSVIQRLKANKARLLEFINEEVENIPELDEELVNVFDEENSKKIPTFNGYGRITTLNII
ncbi:MAG: beta-N-acetylhexosaminidase [Clostridia bacterium]|nr:beta-N-acetylhexosaminidase [Clostridia bacterium]